MATDWNKDKRIIPAENVPVFVTAEGKLDAFHKELEKLSNKKPDGALNKFKLGFINQVLDTLNKIIGDDYRPFPDFLLFDVEGSIPSASDALMMLSQYKAALSKFRSAHAIYKHGQFDHWNTEESVAEEKLAKEEAAARLSNAYEDEDEFDDVEFEDEEEG